MLPDRLTDAIELGRIKDIPLQRTEKKRASLHIEANKPPRMVAPLAAALAFLVAMASLGTVFSHLVTNRNELLSPAFDAMLKASFPYPPTIQPDAPDLPVILPILPEDMTETTAAPETSAAPETTAAPEEIPIIPEGCFPIIDVDLSCPELGEFYISNETPYSPNVSFLSGAPIPAYKELQSNSGPLVLILHTHATEAYSEAGALYYDEASIAPRSDDTSKNVVAIGSVMAETFQKNGIPTVHCTILHDKESYKDSYNRAAATIKEYLKKYPSIQYVFDVHRDSLIRESGEKLRPVTMIDGVATAQVMSVVGTDYMGAVHPAWEKNLSLAANLQSYLNEKYTGIARHIYLRGASFNQQYRNGSLLLEIGSCANSLDEAKRAGVIVAESLSKIIKESKGN